MPGLFIDKRGTEPGTLPECIFLISKTTEKPLQLVIGKIPGP